MLKITDIAQNAMRTARWSGGTTSEIFLYPRTASYAERNFIFRISTARVELDESDFTPLAGFERLIAAVDGELLLLHDEDGAERRVLLEPRRSVHRFDGGTKTRSIGRARDLNLILKKGAASGDMRFVETGEAVLLPMQGGDFALVYPLGGGAARLYEADGDETLSVTADGACALFTVRVGMDERHCEVNKNEC